MSTEEEYANQHHHDMANDGLDCVRCNGLKPADDAEQVLFLSMYGNATEKYLAAEVRRLRCIISEWKNSEQSKSSPDISSVTKEP